MFSELVDICVGRAGRPEKEADVIAFAAQTIRELESKNHLKKNLEEDTLNTTSHPYIWARPNRMQKLRTAKYSSNGKYARFAQPGAILENLTYYFYMTTTSIIFNGHDTIDTIDVAYYQFRKKLQYYSLGAREAVYDFEDETWSFPLQVAERAALVAAGGTDADLAALDATHSAAQAGHIANASNWILFDWYELVQEGTLAKLFKLIDDEKRAATHFSFYQRAIRDEFLPTEQDQLPVT